MKFVVLLFLIGCCNPPKEICVDLNEYYGYAPGIGLKYDGSFGVGAVYQKIRHCRKWKENPDYEFEKAVCENKDKGMI